MAILLTLLVEVLENVVLISKPDVAFVSRFYMVCTLFSLYILYSSFIFIKHSFDVESHL